MGPGADYRNINTGPRHGVGYASVEYVLAGMVDAGVEKRTLWMMRRGALAAPRDPRVGWQRVAQVRYQLWSQLRLSSQSSFATARCAGI